MADPSNLPLTRDDFAKNYRRRVYRGLAIMWGINLVHLASGVLLSSKISFGYANLGFLFIVGYPLIALFYGGILLVAYRDHEGVFKGLLIATFVTLLLSCSCWAYALTHIGG